MDKTLEWLADKLNVGVSSISRWENAENGVQDEIFEAIAQAYGITPAELSAPPEEAARARLLHRVIEAVRKLDDSQLGTIAGLAEQLGDKRKGS